SRRGRRCRPPGRTFPRRSHAFSGPPGWPRARSPERSRSRRAWPRSPVPSSQALSTRAAGRVGFATLSLLRMGARCFARAGRSLLPRAGRVGEGGARVGAREFDFGHGAIHGEVERALRLVLEVETRGVEVDADGSQVGMADDLQCAWAYAVRLAALGIDPRGELVEERVPRDEGVEPGASFEDVVDEALLGLPTDEAHVRAERVVVEQWKVGIGEPVPFLDAVPGDDQAVDVGLRLGIHDAVDASVAHDDDDTARHSDHLMGKELARDLDGLFIGPDVRGWVELLQSGRDFLQATRRPFDGREHQPRLEQGNALAVAPARIQDSAEVLLGVAVLLGELEKARVG